MTALAVVLAVLSIEADGLGQVFMIIGSLVAAIICVFSETA